MRRFICVSAFFAFNSFLWGVCSIGWTSKKDDVFENIGEKCNVAIVEQIGEISLPGGESIPLQADFDSARNTASAFLGFGWFFNLTDTAVVPDGGNAYKVIMPNGLSERLFKEPSKDVYSNPEWALQTRGSGAMELSRKCGTSFSFSNGKIRRIRLASGDILIFQYSSDRLSAIECRGKKLAEFKYGGSGGSVSIVLGDPETPVNLSFKDAKGGKTGKMLSSIEQYGKVRRSYAYDFSNPESYKMEYFAAGLPKRLFTWSPKSGAVSREESHFGGSATTYAYRNAYSDSEYEISRKCEQDGLEDYRYYSVNGISKERKRGGPLITDAVFRMGPKLLPRRRIVEYPGGGKDNFQYMYDAEGRLIRELKNGNIVRVLKRDDKKRSVSLYDGGNVFKWKKVFDERGRITEYELFGGRILSFSYPGGEKILVKDKNGEKTKTLLVSEDLMHIYEQ